MNIPARQFELAKKHDEPLAVVAPPSDASSLMAVISRAASDPQTDVTKLERLLGMYERIKSTDAEQAFNQAMNDAQKAMHRIAADANNPQTKSRYASYAALDRILRPIYTAHGFSLSFDTGEAPDNFVKVVCYVSHAQGHTRTYHIDMPADGKGAKGGDVMTKTHATGAAVSYAMRYLLKMIFNVAVGEDDRDGNDVDQTPQAPAGFDEWLEGLQTAAMSGFASLEAAWAAPGPKGCKAYFTVMRPKAWQDLKKTAQEIDALG